MSPANVKTMLEGVGIPCAYYQFAENTGIQPPFICFFYDRSNDMVADDSNYVRIEHLYIELYTDEKDFELEKRLETVLNDNDLVFTREETFLDGERMHETIYQTEIILEV